MPNIHDARATYAASLAFVPGRDELPLLLNARGLFGCGVEVGVKQGEYSAHLLQHWVGRHLISVDPWMTDAAEAYVDIANVPQDEQERFHQETVARLAPFGDRSSIWRTTSIEASARIPRHSLDFVYLDARHDYASVLEDLAAWVDKVRPGGILAGHDYLDGHFPAGVFGVRSAVDEHFARLGLAVHATLLDEPWLTWMVEVPRPVWSGVEATEIAAPVAPPAVPASSGTVRLTVPTRDGAREFALRLDRGQMSQRLMLESFEAGCMYEEETARLLAETLAPGDTFVDVGAHVGFFSMLAATLVGDGGRVVAFEPEAGNLERLREHVALNEFRQVETVPAAVAGAEGTTELWVNADNDGGHALWDVGEHDFNATSRARPQRRTVPVTTLDATLGGGNGRRVRAMKVDAEGCEELVLRGGEALLRRDRPDVICEINEFCLQRMGSGEQRLRAYLRELGYEAYALPPQGAPVRLADDQRVVSDAVFNLLFRHPVAA
jgi:FkbM family methyltransferase